MERISFGCTLRLFIMGKKGLVWVGKEASNWERGTRREKTTRGSQDRNLHSARHCCLANGRSTASPFSGIVFSLIARFFFHFVIASYQQPPSTRQCHRILSTLSPYSAPTAAQIQLQLVNAFARYLFPAQILCKIGIVAVNPAFKGTYTCRRVFFAVATMNRPSIRQ